MRESFSSLRQMFHDLTQTTSSDATAVTTLRDRELNNAQTRVLGYLKSYLQTTTRTATVTEDQQYYSYPVDVAQPLYSATIDDGSYKYSLKFIESPNKWNKINALQFDTLALPQFIYPRSRDFGIYPTPQNSTDTIELEFALQVRDMSNADYTTGTITATSNSTTVTGAATTFAAWMAGNWIKMPDGLWYRISTFDSTIKLTLETYYEGSTLAGQTYTVGESPELPPELHELLPHYAASKWFLQRKDKEMAQYHSRIFWTGDPDITSNNEDNVLGGIIGAKKDYSTRSDGAIVYSTKRSGNIEDSLNWASELSI